MCKITTFCPLLTCILGSNVKAEYYKCKVFVGIVSLCCGNPRANNIKDTLLISHVNIQGKKRENTVTKTALVLNFDTNYKAVRSQKDLEASCQYVWSLWYFQTQPKHLIGSHRVDILNIYLPYMELVLIITHHTVNLITDVVSSSICLHGPLLKLRIYSYESTVSVLIIMLGSQSSGCTGTLYFVFFMLN